MVRLGLRVPCRSTPTGGALCFLFFPRPHVAFWQAFTPPRAAGLLQRHRPGRPDLKASLEASPLSRTVATVLLVILATLITIAIVGPRASGAAEPSASPSPTSSPTPSVSPTPERAGAALVKRARRCRDRARSARRTLSRVRACFGQRGPVRVWKSPKRSADAKAWTKALRRWRHQARDWRAKVRAGRHAMRHPGGTSCGARWAALALWVGWPRGTLSHLTYIIGRESSGRPRAVNSSSGCTGLLQILRSHVPDPWRLTDPEYNLRVGLRLYRRSGWSPWAL